MPHCCVIRCSSNSRKKEAGVKFYSFPNKYETDFVVKEKWIAAINRTNPDGSPWRPTRSSTVCSKHFVDGKKSTIFGHPNSVPSIFPERYKKCLIKGCVTDIINQENSTFFPLPWGHENASESKNGPRRPQWIEAAGNRVVPNISKICSRHFITGRPSKWEDHPDYVPCLNMGSKQTCDAEDVGELNLALRSSNSEMYSDTKLHGFDRNLNPERIIGTIEIKDGQRCFLIKWLEDLEPDFVTIQDANEKCPQLVIEFYESLIKWKD